MRECRNRHLDPQEGMLADLAAVSMGRKLRPRVGFPGVGRLLPVGNSFMFHEEALCL